MGAFEYTALDSAGRTKKGILEGDTPRQVRDELRTMGFSPLTVTEINRPSVANQRALFASDSLPPADLVMATRQLATLVRAGLPVEETLRAVSRQTHKPRLKSIFMAVRAKVVEGHTLANALGDFPNAFPELYRSTIMAGEQSGRLAEVLERLADFAEDRQGISQRLTLALIYPILVTLVSLAVVTLLLTYVVPQVVEMFAEFHQQLPPLTRALIAVSDFLKAHGIALGIVLFVAFVIFRLALRNERFCTAYHRFLLHVPLIAPLVRGLNTTQFTRTFGILTSSGVPVVEGLAIASRVLNNLPMRRAVEFATKRVREGASLHMALDQSRLFPPITIELIASGEAGGALGDMLHRAATAQEREMTTLIAVLMGLFEPLMILFMGGMVLFIVVAILLPIFDLNQLIK